MGREAEAYARTMTSVGVSKSRVSPERSGVSAALAGIAVLIPARRMELSLEPLIRTLSDKGAGAIIVVSDGMTPAELAQFDQLAAIPHVHLLRHAVNLGKGRALKTGIHYVLRACPWMESVITADADGQHAVSDIEAVACDLESNPSSVVLGCRTFSGHVPLRSRLGNELTRLTFQFFSGREVTDTQTGLRGFPISLLPELLALPGERYEYEMTVLTYLSGRAVPVLERPIQTIYLEGNRSSHFDPLRDSMRVYSVLVRFYAPSLFCAALDLLIFTVAYLATHQLLFSILLGTLSSLVKFALERTLAVRNQRNAFLALGRYYGLAVFFAAISYGPIKTLIAVVGWNVIVAKITVDMTLSLLTFAAQITSSHIKWHRKQFGKAHRSHAPGADLPRWNN